MAGTWSCQQRPKEADKAPGPKLEAWFRSYDFDAATFQRPPLEFGLFTRWWWPGNDVTGPELQREVRLFAANGFAGVEIQPFALGVGQMAITMNPGLKVPLFIFVHTLDQASC